jgi:lysophospholipase L1-like esterase
MRLVPLIVNLTRFRKAFARTGVEFAIRTCHSAIMTIKTKTLLGIIALSLAGCAPLSPQPAAEQFSPQARYVAMGSSFAAGPGVTTPADTPANRCARSADNYAHQLARKLNLQLVDVSCSGAKTENLLGPSGPLPPQMKALTDDTKLVTVTIGGNDVGYIGCLIAASTVFVKNADAATAQAWKCPPGVNASEETWDKLSAALRNVSTEIRHRAPHARLVFVDYPVVLPNHGTCAATPLTNEQADVSRATARRLAELTAQAAKEANADLLRASELSQGHDVCSKEPWMTGFSSPGLERTGSSPYHPNLAGMTAVATALGRLLAR